MSANSLTRAIVQYLNFNGVVAWNVYNGGVYDPTLKIYRKNRHHKHGVFDICGFEKKGGRHVEIEIKIGRDKMSDDQRRHFVDLSEAGALVFVARDFDSFESWFKKQKHEQPTNQKTEPTEPTETEFGSGIT
tara:strand:+ start:3344 stop:3739 length:396 start_codon:yes stop_codon:yes gene_type:complete